MGQTPINGSLKGRILDPQGLSVELANVELEA